MQLNELHETVKFRKTTYKGSRYYDYPDGEDLVGKLAFTTKVAGGVSALLGLLNTRVPPVPRTTSGQMFRLMTPVIPAVGIAVTFTCVTYYSTVLRKKDDQLNYVLGGLAAGTLLGPMLGKLNGSAWFAFYFAVTGYFKKSAEMKGEKLIPNIVQTQFSTYFKRKLDTSLMAERKGNWTRELPAQ